VKRFKRLFKYAIVLLLVLAPLTFLWSWWVSRQMEPFIYTDAALIPERHAGLLLGTSRYSSKGVVNLYYRYRLRAAADLLLRGKIKFIILSGDNSTMYYNEPTTMKRDLANLGVPDSNLVEDFAGFRTLDSVVRSKKVFGQDSVVIISQRWHVERALFIARSRGIKAIGFCAADVDRNYGFKTQVREHFARIKLFIDLYILNKQPKFLGEPVYIPE
jgi:SanA protein